MKSSTTYRTILLFVGLASMNYASAEVLANTIKLVKPAIVAVGSFKATRSPRVIFGGTGFAVSDGLTIVTNAHVLKAIRVQNLDDQLGVLSGSGATEEFRPATVISIDSEHDLAILHIEGAPLHALTLGDAHNIEEGQSIAFTGFPLAAALGFHPATHRGIISAITPITMPVSSSKKLDANVLAQLRRTPFSILQLDATVFPGNSGSPVYDPDTGVVIGIINMTFVKGLKETAITDPSGISYAIPVNFIHKLLGNKN